MSSRHPQSIEHRAQRLVKQVVYGLENGVLGSATVAVYDTAWVSMISRKNQWLFPECFQYLLDTQSTEGGWISGCSLDDDFLNTVVSLLAMVKHARAADAATHGDQSGLEIRISNARSYLEAISASWDINATMRVGFEVLLPAHLSMLENEDIKFNFPGKKALHALNALKMKKFNREKFYDSPSTFLHSLEGFVGQVDFDRLSHHTTFGSMMASPASTAAYLIHSSTWDDSAEEYIRTVIDKGAGKGTGGVPSAFPIPIFESTWVSKAKSITAFDFTPSDLDEQSVNAVADYIQVLAQKQNGLLGFGEYDNVLTDHCIADMDSIAPLVLADADDTARAHLLLSLLGRQSTLENMVEFFRTESGHYKTYPGERDASLSANCNVLNALLYCREPGSYTTEIVSTANFLCDLWWRGEVNDKWNESPQYPRMLLAESLTRLLFLWDIGLLENVPDNLLQERIPVVLTQILNQTLFAQATEEGPGAKDSPEVTAYRILTLRAVASLPWLGLLRDDIAACIESGQHVLSQCQTIWSKPTYICFEKVTYGSATLSEAYCLSAMKASQHPHVWSHRVSEGITISEKAMSKLLVVFSKLEDYRSQLTWKLRASAIEAHVFLHQLRSVRVDILPRQKDAKNEYLPYVPLTWTLVNNVYCLNQCADLLWDMMVLTVCNFRVDEYMETAVAKISDADLEQVRSIIRSLCAVEPPDYSHEDHHSIENSQHAEYRDQSLPGIPVSQMNGLSRNEAILAEADDKFAISSCISLRAVIGKYTRAMLTYPRTLHASPGDRSRYRYSLRTFLLAHVAQIEDNSRFSCQQVRDFGQASVFTKSRSSFYSWAHSTGADSISCPFSFAFLTCLLGAASENPQMKQQSPAVDCFGPVYQKYLAEDLCSHLAVMSRLYNDFGSLKRDHLEANVNSVNFPEFHPCKADCIPEERENGFGENLKKALLELAEHERRCVDVALANLLSNMEQSPRQVGNGRQVSRASAVNLFVNVAKLYADIYVLRDLSNENVEAVGGVSENMEASVASTFVDQNSRKRKYTE